MNLEELKMDSMNETSFRELLRNKGFSVNDKHENDNSIDIVAIKNGEYFLIDVKNEISERIRSDLSSDQVEFTIALCPNNYFYPTKIKEGKHAKAHRFMRSL